MFAEDLTAFFDVTSGFAVAATLAGVAVTGIFDNGYLVQDLGDGVGATGPTFTLPSSQVPSVSVGLALVVNATTYKVVEPVADGTGITTLRLRV